MSNNQILSLLEAHGIQCDVDEEGTAWALDEFTKRGRDYSEWVDVTGWDRSQVMNWLGY